MKTQRAVIFDFDGTLADIEELIKKLYGEAAASRGWPALTDERYKELRTGTLASALKWVGVRPWQLPGLMKEGRNRLYEVRDQIKLFPGVKPVIAKLHQDGWHIYVLSANSTKTIHQVLARYGIDHMVTVLKRPAIFGKATSINKLVWQKRYDRTQVWMIGDEVRDIEAATKADVNSIAVAWGIQDVSLLKQYNPTAVAKTAKDVESILKQGIITK
jgi:phosphoglycolate phosphatase